MSRKEWLIRFGFLAGALILIAPVLPGFAAPVESPAIAAASGPWEIALEGSTKKCGLVLHSENANTIDRTLAIPSGCRHSMPALGPVRGWTVRGDGAIVFDAKAGEAELVFTRKAESKWTAKGPDGEAYEMTPTGRQDLQKGFAAIPVAAPANAAPKPVKEPEPTTRAAVTHYPGKLSDLGGRYVILREGVEGGKDVGCMLTLDDQSRGPGGFRAQLAPACRDNGIVIFEPVGWNFEHGRLLLTARKGHHATFDYHADGGWWKDPREGGKPLGVRHF